jgi:hypothetical protein
LLVHTGLALADSATFLVATFAGDDVAIAKLNEAFYRSEIEGGSYEKLELEVTSRERRARLIAFWEDHVEELADAGSPLSRLVESDSAAADLPVEIAELHARALGRIAPLDARGDMPGRVDHGAVARLRRDVAAALGGAGYAARALVFKDVSRLKSPTAHLIQFTHEQKTDLLAGLRPGDLLLTYTSGHMSDVFIPGHFKHGITYVGDGDARRAAGLTGPFALPPQDACELERLREHVAYDRFDDGRRADVIEAVAEGVKFSSLDTLLDTHIDRLVVLRPQIDPSERAAFLIEVFSYLGDPYDFRSTSPTRRARSAPRSSTGRSTARAGSSSS